MTPEQQTPASVVEAATELSHFAWSAVRADCVEAEMNLNRLLGNLRAALTQGESRHKAAPAPEGMREAIEVATEWLAIVENTPLQHGVIRRPPICRTEIEAIRTILAIIAKGEGRE